MVARFRLLSVMLTPLLIGLGISLLPLPPWSFAGAIAQTSPDERKAEADRLLEQGIQQFPTRQFREALQSWQTAL